METGLSNMFSTTILYSGDYIFVKPFCDFFNINYENQIRNIQGDEILKSEATKKSNKMLFNDKKERYTLSKKGFIRWIQRINPQIVQVSLREKLKQYQIFIFDFLFGSLESDEEIKVQYARLKKLRGLYSRVGNEIQLCERKVRSYMDNRFTPPELPFTK